MVHYMILRAKSGSCEVGYRQINIPPRVGGKYRGILSPNTIVVVSKALPGFFSSVFPINDVEGCCWNIVYNLV